MPRNLDRRVEIMFPVIRKELKERIRRYMEIQLADNLKAHVLMPDGSYQKPELCGREPVGAQKTLCEMAVAAAREKAEGKRNGDHSRVFIPVESHNE